MTRDKYIKMRRESSYDLSAFYSYYIEKFPTLKKFKVNGVEISRHQLTFPEFVELFRVALQTNGQEILNFLDGKFEVQKIENDKNEIIYIK